jgi:hypothetical protein
LQKATLAVDEVIKEEVQWRHVKQIAYQQEQYEQYQARQKQVQQPQQSMQSALYAGAPVQPGHPSPPFGGTGPAPSMPDAAAAAAASRILISAAPTTAPSPPTASGFVHPSRAPVVGAAASTGAAVAAPPPRKLKKRTREGAGSIGGSADATGSEGKRKKMEPSSLLPSSSAADAKLGRMSELVNKWAAVAKASEEQERIAERMAQNRWRGGAVAEVSAPNQIPVSDDWRLKVAARIGASNS